MSDKKPNASTIEARISVVKACAALELDRQNKFIEETIAHYAAQQITFREQYNQKFFVKLLRKQKRVVLQDYVWAPHGAKYVITAISTK